MLKSTTRNTLHAIRHTIPPRCDNCFFSVWVINPNKPLLTCKQKENMVGRWWGVNLDDKCANFYPSGTFKLGDQAVRRIPLTQGKFALVDADDYYRLAKFPWQALKGRTTFYAVRGRNRKHLMMHRAIMDAPADLIVDHIDHNGLNNCRSNLRLCTPAQNVRNSVAQSGTSSKYKGVHWHKSMRKWAVQIHLNEKRYRLGYFTDEIEAAKAYDKKAAELHGEFACLNFPPNQQQPGGASCPNKSKKNIRHGLTRIFQAPTVREPAKTKARSASAGKIEKKYRPSRMAGFQQ